MRVVDLIRKKRDGAELSREEIEFLIEGVTRERIPDYQIAAWLMAVVWREMSSAELALLTEAMLHSGLVLDWSDLPAAKVDKHSTGGVGDKTSLIIGPIVCIIMAKRRLPIFAFIISSIGAIWAIMSPPVPPSGANCALAGAGAIEIARNSAAVRHALPRAPIMVLSSSCAAPRKAVQTGAS